MSADRYRWIVLLNTTIGVLMATINGSILLISLPDTFRGIDLDPLAANNQAYFLWILMGFMLVTSVLVVGLGRLGDMFGRVRLYTLGFATFTVFSVLLSVTWMHGTGAALWIVAMRIGQGVGGALLFANSSAILTDAFPLNQRGLALGINGVAAMSGSFLGLVIGGVLAPLNWRLVFLVSVPFGLLGTVWSIVALKDNGMRLKTRIDWWGNLTFAIGLIALLVGMVYGLQPYGGHAMGWTSPKVIGSATGGALLLLVFALIELRSDHPMFDLRLFSRSAFAMGNAAALLTAVARGGLQFMLVIWLQGIWLPLHGVSFARTPLWAALCMLPLTIGFLVAGPIAGRLSDRFGARPFATAGLLLTALGLFLLQLLPMDFAYPWFAIILFADGLSMGLFAAPNSSDVMSSLPADQRGSGAGMFNTFQNSASVISISAFFTVIALGLASTLPRTMYGALVAHGVSSTQAHTIADLPPVGCLFAAFLGYNPVQQALGPDTLSHLTQQQQAYLTGRSFFPQLMSGPFAHGLHLALLAACGCCLLAAVCSAFRPGKRSLSEADLLCLSSDVVEPPA